MRTVRLLLGIAGSGLVAYGAYGLLTEVGTTPPIVMLAAVVVHDFVVIPLAIAGGWLAARVAPPWARAPAQVALLVTLALGVVAIPALVKAGTFPDNPSVLPLDYRRGLLTAVGVTWLIAGGVAMANRQRSRRDPPQGTDR